jgi:phosphoribosylaminoimidazole carboxylase/phosphoribosylaminoimidazole-succinocarboxamide synthase
MDVPAIDPEKLQQVAEGKTKVILDIPTTPFVVIRSKDKITAFNAERQHSLEGKAAVSNSTTCKVFGFLNSLGLHTHFVRQNGPNEFIARKCSMIPIEWVTRRIATGSFLKRNQGVKEGYRFSPPKLEMFFKDDAAGDPQWSEEMLLESKMNIGGLLIGEREVDLMSRVTVAIFEVLERAWANQGCSLIDMKVEFGVDVVTKDIILADVIDSDSWRLWPSGDKRLQVDKQFYRDLPEVTADDLKKLKEKFEWVSEKLDKFHTPPKGRVAVLLGSESDKAHGEKIRSACLALGIPCEVRVSSAHKGTAETMKLISKYEGDGIPTVFIACAGRSNGLGPVTSGMTVYPVINCPPISAEWGSLDVWSSLRLPSDLSCATILSPESGALSAASIFGMHDHVIWGRLRMRQLINHVKLMKADKAADYDNAKYRIGDKH